MDTVSFKTCLSYCQHLETLEVMFRNSQKHYKGLSASARISLGAEAFSSDNSAAVYMAKIGLSVPELAIIQFSESVRVNGSALHHVAKALAQVGFGSDDVMEGWSQLGVDIIQNGADLFSMKSYKTPLLVILDEFAQSYSPISDIRRPLQRWNDILRRANVDLDWYCAREFETWKTLDYGTWKFRSTNYRTITRLVKVKFCHETQSCILVFRDEVVIPVMRLRLMPGSFCRSQYPVETICWKPLSEDEKEEGHWSRVRTLVIRSSLTYDYDPEQEPGGWYNKLIDCTQDDNGTLLRMTRSYHDGNHSSKRASSQPPSQRRTRHGDQTLFSSRTHKWLPIYHYCFVRSTWTVSCHLWRWQRALEPRLCAYQKDSDDTEEYPWLGDESFLKEIRNCKYFRDTYSDPLHPLLRHSHRIGCPQGCDQVDLEQLAKPPVLPRWHPGRNEL
jgi:hypothetical protein